MFSHNFKIFLLYLSYYVFLMSPLILNMFLLCLCYFCNLVFSGLNKMLFYVYTTPIYYYYYYYFIILPSWILKKVFLNLHHSVFLVFSHCCEMSLLYLYYCVFLMSTHFLKMSKSCLYYSVFLMPLHILKKIYFLSHLFWFLFVFTYF